MKNILFSRDIQNLDNEYTQKIQKILTIDTITKWTKHKTTANYNHRYKEWYLSYRFKVLQDWFLKNKNDEQSLFIDQLQKIINRLYLKNFLNASEINYINRSKALVFTKNRNLKRLVTDFYQNPNEWSFFHYINIDASSIFKNADLVDLHLTNQRIVLVYKDQTFSFYYDYITKYNFKKTEISFSYHKKEYKLKVADANIIKLSLIRIYKMIGRLFDYE